MTIGQTPFDDEIAPAATTLELRQIAGLTAGVSMTLDQAGYEFAEGDRAVAFAIAIDGNNGAVVVPGSVPARLDGRQVDAPTLIGSSALDVGSARFLVRPRLEPTPPSDWLEGTDVPDRPEIMIEVPELVDNGVPPSPPGQRRLFGRRRNEDPTNAGESLDVTSQEFIGRIRAARTYLADHERLLHPDPAELAARAGRRAPILGLRSPDHPLFAKVNVIVADMPWMPLLDDIKAVPDSMGPHLRPLMSLPSIPIAADLMIGPLGIVGSRVATTACARHIVASLLALSLGHLRIHISASAERDRVWDWAYSLTERDDIDPEAGFPVVVVDGMENFGRFGLDHATAIDHRAGVVILTDSIDDLPAYSGSVLQVDTAGSGLLTNHLGHVIAGTPVGITNDFARQIADDLVLCQ